MEYETLEEAVIAAKTLNEDMETIVKITLEENGSISCLGVERL